MIRGSAMQDQGSMQGRTSAPQRRMPPYGPVSPVIEILEHYRRNELPQAFDRALLRRLDIAPNNESKVLNTLQWLGFTDDAGRPTTVFRRLQASSTEEFERVLRERLRAAYSAFFDELDPTTASYDDSYRFFARNYSMSLGDPMARLFVGLCRTAGLSMAETRRSAGAAARKTVSSSRGQQPRRQQPEPAPAARPPDVSTVSGSETTPEALEEDLRRLYLRKLIEGLTPLPLDPNLDPERLSRLAELRAAELDRIERLLQAVQ